MVIVFCPQCGSEVDKNDKFCSNCGEKLNKESNNEINKSDLNDNDEEDLNFDDMDVNLGKNSLSNIAHNNDSRSFNWKKILLILAAIFIPIIGPVLVIRSNKFTKKGKIVAGIWLVVGMLGIVIPDGNNSPPQETTKTTREEYNLEFSGDINLETNTNDDKIIMTINSNVPDGGIFELAIMNSSLNMKSDFIEIENGEIRKEFTIPNDWPVGYYSGLANFRFNLEEHPQPKKIQQIYGTKGENLKGDLITETTEGGYTANLKTETIAYPSQQAVDNKNNRIFNEKVNQFVEDTNGIILGIEKAFDDWESVNVIVSDSWYYSAKHEKERFVDQVSSSVTKLLINTEKVNSDDYVQVYFKDTYGEILAEPKLFGGHEIKK